MANGVRSLATSLQRTVTVGALRRELRRDLDKAAALMGAQGREGGIPTVNWTEYLAKLNEGRLPGQEITMEQIVGGPKEQGR